MTNNPDQIREEIERTREELGYDVDALADKVRPSSIAHRQAGKVRGAVSSVRERVMGVATDARESTGSAMASAGHAVGEAPRAVARQAEGHPIAVGLIAFGAGLLFSAMIPSSAKERELAQSAKESAEPLVQELADAAQSTVEQLKQPAKEAVESVKESAQEAVHTVKEEGKASAKRS